MSLAVAAKLVMAAVRGPCLTARERLFFESYQPAGLTLFGRNISVPFTETRELTSELRSCYPASEWAPLIAIDQEGGRVARIRDPQFPEIGAMLKAPSDNALEEYGFQLGQALWNLGININFAPVLDILTEESNHSIGDRCFGRSWEEVSRRTLAYLKGLGRSPVLACGKHFPGQGDARADTHLDGAWISASRSQLWHRELQPFLHSIQFGVPMIMVSHAIYPEWDPLEKPASLSLPVIDFLRGTLGFQGVVVSDDMNMKAIAQDDKSWCEAILESVAAGCDLILVCDHWERAELAIQALSQGFAKNPSLRNRAEQALERITKVRSSVSH